MDTLEIGDLILRVNEFEQEVESKVNRFLKESGSRATFNRIVWGNSDMDELCAEVSMREFPEEAWKEYFPLKYFSENFDIGVYIKEKCNGQRKTD